MNELKIYLRIRDYIYSFERTSFAFVYIYVLILEFFYKNIFTKYLLKSLFLTLVKRGNNDLKLILRIRHILLDLLWDLEITHDVDIYLLNLDLKRELTIDLNLIEKIIGVALQIGKFREVAEMVPSMAAYQTFPQSFLKYLSGITYSFSDVDRALVEFKKSFELLKNEKNRELDYIYYDHIWNLNFDKEFFDFDIERVKINNLNYISSNKKSLHFIASCDVNYFKIYHASFIEEFTKNNQGNLSIFVAVTNENEKHYCESIATRNMDCKSGQVTIVTRLVKHDLKKCKIGVYSSLLRFIEAGDVLLNSNDSVMILDIDINSNYNFEKLIESFNVNIGVTTSQIDLTPWSKYSVGITFINNDYLGQFFIKVLNKFYLNAIDKGTRWTIDQVGFYLLMEKMASIGIFPYLANFESVGRELTMLKARNLTNLKVKAKELNT